MRILAVDYGGKRTGLAVSDEIGITAQGLDTVTADDPDSLSIKIARISGELGVSRVIVGLPLNMDGSESEMSADARAFGEKLAVLTGLPVVYWDERLTSRQAQRVLHEMGGRIKGNKHAIDRISATILLQDYLKTLP